MTSTYWLSQRREVPSELVAAQAVQAIGATRRGLAYHVNDDATAREIIRKLNEGVLSLMTDDERAEFRVYVSRLNVTLDA